LRSGSPVDCVGCVGSVGNVSSVGLVSTGGFLSPVGSVAGSVCWGGVTGGSSSSAASPVEAACVCVVWVAGCVWVGSVSFDGCSTQPFIRNPKSRTHSAMCRKRRFVAVVLADRTAGKLPSCHISPAATPAAVPKWMASVLRADFFKINSPPNRCSPPGCTGTGPPPDPSVPDQRHRWCRYGRFDSRTWDCRTHWPYPYRHG